MKVSTGDQGFGGNDRIAETFYLTLFNQLPHGGQNLRSKKTQS